MADKLETATSVRAGTKIIYTAGPGEIIGLFPDGKRAVIAHPNEAPRILNFDGTTEPLVFTEGPAPMVDHRPTSFFVSRQDKPEDPKKHQFY